MESLLAHCTAVFAGQGGYILVFFLAGLTGSLTHCLAMCGPVVACQAACGKACGKTLGVASQWRYHAGRLLTYGALGFVASAVARQLSAYSFWPMLSAVMLVLAGVLFVLSGVLPSAHRSFFTSSQSGFVRGALMGFMPCGLIYAALMVAATVESPWVAMAAMWSFVLGTTPLLLLAGSGAALLAQRWRAAMGRIGRIGLTCNGLTLLVMAVNLVR